MLILTYSLLVLARIIIAGAEDCQDLSNHPHAYLLNQEPCGRGVDESATSNRIADGSTTALGSYPWMAIIAIKKENMSNESVTWRECAGTVINDRYIMTAARCFDDPGDKTTVNVWFRVYQRHRLSIINCDLKKCIQPPHKVEAESFVAYPDQYYDSIALIRLKEKITFDEFVKPICLPMACDLRNFDYVGRAGMILGWDHLGGERTGLEDSALEKSSMTVIARETCKKMWEPDLEIRTSHICASSSELKVPCKKDVGGPLLMESHLDGYRMYQIGTITTPLCGIGNVDVSRPTAFAKVGFYIPFILENIVP